MRLYYWFDLWIYMERLIQNVSFPLVAKVWICPICNARGFAICRLGSMRDFWFQPKRILWGKFFTPERRNDQDDKDEASIMLNK